MKKIFKAVELNQLTTETCHQLLEWRNQEFVRSNMYSQEEISLEEHLAYLEKIRQDKQRGIYVFYLDEQPFGIFQYMIEASGNYAVPGNYLIKEEYSEFGYGVVLNYFQNEIIFYRLGCNKSVGEVLANNRKALALSKKMSGRIEGTLRQHIIINGNYNDVVRFGLLKSEWEEKRKKIGDLVFEFVSRDYQVID